jgi:hypothetical protein
MKIEMLRMRSVAGSMLVFIAVSAWLAVSNHCTLSAALAPEEKVAQNECPFHSHPSKPAKHNDSSDQPCCKVLRAIATTPGKSLAPIAAELTDVDFSLAKLLIIPPKTIPFQLTAFDIGPPGATSFVELVLQRSILAHAPPLLA